jgi:hypothetical protein
MFDPEPFVGSVKECVKYLRALSFEKNADGLKQNPGGRFLDVEIGPARGDEEASAGIVVSYILPLEQLFGAGRDGFRGEKRNNGPVAVNGPRIIAKLADFPENLSDVAGEDGLLSLYQEDVISVGDFEIDLRIDPVPVFRGKDLLYGSVRLHLRKLLKRLKESCDRLSFGESSFRHHFGYLFCAVNKANIENIRPKSIIHWTAKNVTNFDMRIKSIPYHAIAKQGMGTDCDQQPKPEEGLSTPPGRAGEWLSRMAGGPSPNGRGTRFLASS